MDQFISQVTARIGLQAGDLVSYFSAPWALYQLLIIAGCYGASWLMASRVEAQLEEWARGIKGNPGLLRLLIAIMRRIDQLLFIALLAIARWVVLATSWPSRTYILSVALTLAIAWFASAVLGRIIRSRAVSRFISIGIFTYVALGVLGVRGDVSAALDAAAVNLGDFRLSALFVLRVVVVTTAFLWIAGLLGNFLDNRINRLDDLSPSFKVLAGKVVKISLIVLAGLMALSATGLDLTALTIFSGAVGVGLGFGLQKIVSNFISGVIILADKSIKPGDTIQLGETFGWIRELRARFVSVVTRDGREYLIPNEDLITQQVVNWSFSDKLVRLDVDFGVSYDSNPHEVTKLAIEATKSVPRVLGDKAPVCWMTAFGESSLDFKLRFWITDPQAGLTNVRGQVLLALWDIFDANNINIPFPHREIIMRTPVEVETKGG